jgi:hypothetical protein
MGIFYQLFKYFFNPLFIFLVTETNPTLIIVDFILFCRRGKKKLKPADVIPDVSIIIIQLIINS